MTHWTDSYFRFLKGLLTALLAVMVVPVTLQIVTRYTGWLPRYIWTEEVARFCFVWLIMVGSAVAVREGAHFEVSLFPSPSEGRAAVRARLVVHGCMTVMAFVFTWFGIEFVRFGVDQQSEMTGINLAFIYAAFPVAGISWCVFLFEKIAADIEEWVEWGKPRS